MKRLYKELNWLGQELLYSWRVSKFNFFPTEKNLLISFWYDFDYYVKLRAGSTVYDFLDLRVRSIEERMERPECKPQAKRLYGYLLTALHHSRLRAMIIAFLESPSPEESYEPVRDALRSAWRMGNESAAGKGVEEEDGTAPSEDAAEDAVEEAAGEARPLHAKTYFIAAELYFELAGREVEFQVKSRQVAELMTFVKEQFGVKKLPGTFDKLKGYTYKSVLTGRNEAKKGQLKPHFRQIAENPQVFGEAIAERAGKILAKNFN